MPDPNNIVLHEQRVVLMLICKAGNTSIKQAVGSALGLRNVAQWQHELSTANKAACRHLRTQGYRVLGTVRHPLARLVSCWADKVERSAQFHEPLRRKYGERVWPGMPFADFARFVCGVPDEAADQHFRGAAWDLCATSLVPDTLLRMENPTWWDALAGVLRAQGLEIGPARTENRTGRGADWRQMYRPDLRTLVERRYADDLEAFGYG